MRNLLALRRAFLCVVVGAVVVGCQKGNPNAPAKISGRVSYKGSSVTCGSVILTAKDGGSSVGLAIAADGTYTGSDLPIGEMIVTIETESANPDRKTPDYKGGSSIPLGGAGGGGGMYGGKGVGGGMQQKKGAEFSPGQPTAAGAYMKIPSKYADPKTSGLTVTLERGSQTKNFDLND